MTAPSSTPGPWWVGVSCDHTPAVTVPVPAHKGSGFVIAHINPLPRMASVRGDADANARLIAAAPDLLAALKHIAELCDADNGAHWLTHETCADRIGHLLNLIPTAADDEEDVA